MRSFVALLGLGLSLVACGSAKTPDRVKSELAASPPGTVTIVAFTDYECPYCRTAHQELVRALQASAGLKVRFVRHHVPLPMHPHADAAARAAICVEALGGDTVRMDDALFAAGSAKLDLGSLEEAGEYAGVDRDKLADCVRTPAVDQRLRADLETYMQSGASGVPLHFVGSSRFEGAQDTTTFQDALTAAAAEASRPRR